MSLVTLARPTNSQEAWGGNRDLDQETNRRSVERLERDSCTGLGIMNQQE